MRRLPILVETSISDARMARIQVAEAFQRGLAQEVLSCTKGCSNCCYHPVLLTLLEGITLYRWLVLNHLWSRELKETLLATATKTRGLALEVWSLSLIPCPLLDQEKGLCKAYAARPFSCQVTYSIGDPQACHPHSLGPGMLPKRELFEALAPVEARALKKHHLSPFKVPLASALLYGEKIAKEEIALEDCGVALWQLPAG